MTRPAALAAMLLAMLARADAPAPYVQAVEFPFQLCPPSLWERELVRLKNLGVDTVEFSLPPEWHETSPGVFDFTGATNPRRNLVGFIRLLRRVGMQAWVDAPPRAASAALASQTSSHGGPVAWVSPALPEVDAPAPPAPVQRIAAGSAGALVESREAIAQGRGALLWTGVYDALYPAGWAPPGSSLLREGAIGLNGEQRASGALRREALLLRGWSALLGSMQAGPAPRVVNGKFPAGVTARLLVSGAASAVSIVNRGDTAFHDDVRAVDPLTKRTAVIPGVYVGPGEALWLPVDVSLSQNSLCRECSNFSPAEQVLYANAELLSIEYENGILAVEFSAPRAGSVVLQLGRQPVGPLLAAGKPTEFEWDEKTLRARLPIPAGKAPDYHVRIGIAMEEPETSAFFDDAQRLIIGSKNVVSTTYSSPQVAARSRLRLPEGYTAEQKMTTPNQAEYEIAAPESAAAGDYANLALEADGMALGRARLELFHALTVTFGDAVALHFGKTALTADPPVVAFAAGTDVEYRLRNNWPAIETYKLEWSGPGFIFFPPKQEITIGAANQRDARVRAFGTAGFSMPALWNLRVGGAASLDLPVRAVPVPKSGAVAWSADLDEDGAAEWVLESAEARAVFSTQDGGRWMEFTWKDGSLNFLPVQGVFGGSGAVEVKASGDALVFAGKGWTRTVRLEGAALTVEQTTALPPDGLTPGKQGGISLSIARSGERSARYSLGR